MPAQHLSRRAIYSVQASIGLADARSVIWRGYPARDAASGTTDVRAADESPEDRDGAARWRRIAGLEIRRRDTC
jgi:hypothetical protein